MNSTSTPFAKDATLDTMGRVRHALAEMREEYLDSTHGHPWIVAFSGGKDSTLVLQLVCEMLLGLAPADRHRAVHVLSNNTLVESPVVQSFVDRTLERMRRGFEALGLNIAVEQTTPEVDQTFWVNLIGRGYPSPNRMFRWCTDRMKIQPTSNYIRESAAATGGTVLLIGVRRDESATRAVQVNKYTSADGARLNPHNDLKGCMVYRPIVDFTTEEVWALLMQRRPPWGGSHRELVTLYRNAQGGECPFVMDKESAPSCGTSSSRFGCWTCTVVEKDRSMAGFIDSGHENLEPLLEFRDWLAKLRDKREYRQVGRRNGIFATTKTGESILGPYTPAARKMILDELLRTQAEVGMELISAGELRQIEAIWAEDALSDAQRILNAVNTSEAGQ